MSFIAEDGTGLTDANSFISVEYADAYFSDRGNAVWEDLDEGQKETALVAATDYIIMRFGLKLSGRITYTVQALPFPRSYSYSDEIGSVPVALKKATAEYALRASQAPLAPDLTYDDTGRLYTKKREEVGPIVEETTYASITGSAPVLYKPYPVPDGYMYGLLSSAGGGIIRA